MIAYDTGNPSPMLGDINWYKSGDINHPDSFSQKFYCGLYAGWTTSTIPKLLFNECLFPQSYESYGLPTMMIIVPLKYSHYMYIYICYIYIPLNPSNNQNIWWSWFDGHKNPGDTVIYIDRHPKFPGSILSLQLSPYGDVPTKISHLPSRKFT